MAEQYGEEPIVGLGLGENSRQFLTPTPVRCDDHYTVYTFDEGGFPYPRRDRPTPFPGPDSDITVQFGPRCR
jgi:hypothetical protein